MYKTLFDRSQPMEFNYDWNMIVEEVDKAIRRSAISEDFYERSSAILSAYHLKFPWAKFPIPTKVWFNCYEPKLIFIWDVTTNDSIELTIEKTEAEKQFFLSLFSQQPNVNQIISRKRQPGVVWLDNPDSWDRAAARFSDVLSEISETSNLRIR